VPRAERALVYTGPSDEVPRRGAAAGGYRLPAYRFARGPGCASWWVEVYTEGWICGDLLATSALAPDAPLLPELPAGQLTPFPCAFVGEAGAPLFDRLADVPIGFSARWLEAGYAVSVRGRSFYDDERLYRTAGGDYVLARDVFIARPSAFHGTEVRDLETIGWTFRQSTRRYDELPRGAAARADVLGPQVLFSFTAEHEVGGTRYLELADGGYVRVTDVRRPEYLAPPEEVGPYDVWFDVDRAQQVLVVYEGRRPIYATLISSGRREHETPPGVYRIWVKLITDRMANEEPSDPEEKPYYLEDVPWVMYFNDDIALHGAYWHKAFGHVRSHGCVNLSPLDARWVFEHAQPALPRGWWSVLATGADPGSLVRVR
jgi:hypothetical protein